ncbi:MAG: methylmalonyl Co-A mutase-associated GTPase MeaB [Labedaea sp.]
MDVPELVARAREGEPLAVARLISLVEDASPLLRQVAEALAPSVGRARVLGLTGPPGVGKSTLTSALIAAFRQQDKRVGVLAIDPSSPFSGGALLGDRIRMQSHTTDPSVFIRSMATRGALGGLALATPQAVRVLDAAGCDVILIETVGVGQSEVDIVSLADTTLVLLAPGMGDGIQAAKAGILEVADVFVVNKADRDGAESTARDLRNVISLGRRDNAGAHSWRPPVVCTVASTAAGMDDLLAALSAHQEWLTAHGGLRARRARRAREEIEAIAVRDLRARLDPELLDRLATEVAAGELDPYAAAERWSAHRSP